MFRTISKFPRNWLCPIMCSKYLAWALATIIWQIVCGYSFHVYFGKWGSLVCTSSLWWASPFNLDASITVLIRWLMGYDHLSWLKCINVLAFIWSLFIKPSSKFHYLFIFIYHHHHYHHRQSKQLLNQKVTFQCKHSIELQAPSWEFLWVLYNIV